MAVWKWNSNWMGLTESRAKNNNRFEKVFVLGNTADLYGYGKKVQQKSTAACWWHARHCIRVSILPIIFQCITWTILFKSIIVVLPYCRCTYEVQFHWPHGQIIILWVPQSLCAQNLAENHTTRAPQIHQNLYSVIFADTPIRKPSPIYRYIHQPLKLYLTADSMVTYWLFITFMAWGDIQQVLNLSSECK